MTREPFDEEVTETFVLALLTALAQGPIGEAMIEVASGRRRIRLVEHRTKAGWVIETEAVEGPTE